MKTEQSRTIKHKNSFFFDVSMRYIALFLVVAVFVVVVGSGVGSAGSVIMKTVPETTMMYVGQTYRVDVIADTTPQSSYRIKAAEWAIKVDPSLVQVLSGFYSTSQPTDFFYGKNVDSVTIVNSSIDSNGLSGASRVGITSGYVSSGYGTIGSYYIRPLNPGTTNLTLTTLPNWFVQFVDQDGYDFYSPTKQLVQFTILPAPVPSLNIMTPANGTLYKVPVNSLSYTASNATNCSYSTDGGVTYYNATCGQTVTGLNAKQGWNNWTVWANNSYGNTNTSISVFYYENVSVSGCRVLNVSNTVYSLTGDINAGNTPMGCLGVEADNITLDGVNHTVFGNGGIGIFLQGHKGIVLKDINVMGFDTDINATSGTSGSIVLSYPSPSIPNGTLRYDINGTFSMVNLTAVPAFVGGALRPLMFDNIYLGSLASLDLRNNDLVVRKMTSPAVGFLIAQGYNGGSWNGLGIMSSTESAGGGFGYLTGSLYTILHQPGIFDGYHVSSSDVIVKSTYGGDSNLDGKITADDYAQIDAGFLMHTGTGWINGNYNYDSVVDYRDYATIDAGLVAYNNPASQNLILQHATQFGQPYTQAIELALSCSDISNCSIPKSNLVVGPNVESFSEMVNAATMPLPFAVPPELIVSPPVTNITNPITNGTINPPKNITKEEKKQEKEEKKEAKEIKKEEKKEAKEIAKEEKKELKEAKKEERNITVVNKVIRLN